tara:strand:- start:539 stop:880 length:342 start_codon:yes stop_codon:yes gene_type:complete
MESNMDDIKSTIEKVCNEKINLNTIQSKNKINMLCNLTNTITQHVVKHGGVLNNNYKVSKNILDKWIQYLDLLYWAMFGLSDNLEYNTMENKIHFIHKKIQKIQTRFIKMNII